MAKTTTLSKEELIRRLNRVAGQVAGIQRMVEDDRYCIDVLNQIAAATRALEAVGISLVARHLESCVLGTSDTRHRQAKPLSQEQLLAEVQTALTRLSGRR
ncbi:MAG: metal-sensitive transcriptional regulator [Verrucomicrobia bacterium]|nr:metal-sensitive transcriptional regulator [Verrucomicrobiota bacterium]